MPALFLAWGLFYYFYGGVINVNNGFGYDGVIYGNITKNFYESVFGKYLSMYRIQRVFPSFAVDSILRILHLPKKTTYIIYAFQLYNLGLLLICTNLWYRISKIFGLELKYIWAGFVLGFVSFGIAEFTFYYPVLTDSTAFFLGFCLLYSHLKNYTFAKIVIAVIGAFTWQVLIVVSLLLIIFPYKKLETPENSNGSSSVIKRFILPCLISLPFLLNAVYYIFIYLKTGSLSLIDTQIYNRLMYITAVMNFFRMSYWLSEILPFGFSFRNYFNLIKKTLSEIKIGYLILCVLIYILMYAVQKYLSNSEAVDGGSAAKLFYFISVYCVTKPLVFIVTAVTYYGPVFIFLFLFMKYYKVHIYELGTGVVISFIISFLMLFATEARLISYFVPFILLLTVLVLRDLNMNNIQQIILTIFSFILSKVYIPMFNIPGNPVDKFTFPDQLLFMNIYTLSKETYFIQGGVIFVFTVIIYLSFRRQKPSESSQIL